MKIDILTLFPEMVTPVLESSIIKRAITKGLVTINVINFRKYSKLNNNQVDDTPFGGGSGMVLMCDPIFSCLDEIRTPESKVILMTPAGEVFKQSRALDLSKEKHLIIICGHYEGVDERILSICDYEISIGDYVLTGGELASLVLCDSIIRLIPGVISDGSLDSESFTDNLLDYPVYTKPRVYRDMEVPEVLLSGDHAKIASWRKEQRIKKTQEKRPDLLR